jgi:hypothetical protein
MAGQSEMKMVVKMAVWKEEKRAGTTGSSMAVRLVMT